MQMIWLYMYYHYKRQNCKLSQCFGPVLQIVDVKHKSKTKNQSYDFSTTSEKNDGIFYIGNEKIDIV